MATKGLDSVVRSVFDALFRPHRFVEFQTSTYASTRGEVVRQAGSLFGVYLVNLMAYAIPLTLAGIGVQQSGQPPAGYATAAARYGVAPTASWQLLTAFVLNSLYITVAAAVTLLTFHAGLVLARGSRGIVQSAHTVVYTTSAYLAAVFSGVWYLTTGQGVSGARELVRNLQAAFVYAIIDRLGADLELPGGRPGTVAVESISPTGQWVLALLALALCYYLVSLYFGARVNHLASKGSATLAVCAVVLSPVVYVAASVLAVTIGVA
ncbi:hypothetical protein [Haloarcula laminariae]|uniref:hypothetical protein n=1 Tax=Haloarcula laminariae TaxID=2961577 RepID=UPI0021C8881F|nr:hypothetical protein [Halomicroarcula laminariae]